MRVFIKKCKPLRLIGTSANPIWILISKTLKAQICLTEALLTCKRRQIIVTTESYAAAEVPKLLLDKLNSMKPLEMGLRAGMLLGYRRGLRGQCMNNQGTFTFLNLIENLVWRVGVGIYISVWRVILKTWISKWTSKQFDSKKCTARQNVWKPLISQFSLISFETCNCLFGPRNNLPDTRCCLKLESVSVQN